MQRPVNQRVFLLKSAIVNELQSLHIEGWMELGLLTGHENLARNYVQFDWPDILVDNPTAQYEATMHFVDTVVEEDEDNLSTILDYLELPMKIKERDPNLFAKLFRQDQLLMDEIRSRAVFNLFDVNNYLMRISEAVDDDPALAIGSMKELLESLMKHILDAQSEALAGDERVPDLLKKTQMVLSLDPGQVNASVKGSKLVKRTLSNLGQIVDGIAQLRNLYGTGHGRLRDAGVSPRHARLVVNAGAALAMFLIETHEHHQSDST